MKRIEIINPQHLARLLMVFCMLVIANAPAGTKDFALHQAVLDDDKQLVTQLLSKGAAIDVIGSRKYGYGSALHLAVREGHFKIAKLLLDRGAQVDVLDPDDFTPLHNAAWNGNLEMTELLLGAGADINASTYDGDTPLSLAQKNDQPQIAEFIQAKLQASLVGETRIETTQPPSLTGTYIADISGNNTKSIISEPKFEIKIVQNGNQLTGSFGESGKVYGNIEGNKIKFEWIGYQRSGRNGRGKWTIKPGSNELVGTWESLTINEGSGRWNLTKIEDEPAQVVDVSGTYIAETTGGNLTYLDTKIVTEMNGKLIVLKQTGNTITGTDSSKTIKIKGTREGNIINFYIISGYGDIVGSWEINADATHLEGKWLTDDGYAPSSKWNLTKIE